MDNQNQNNLVSSSGQKTPIIKDGISVIFAGDSYGLFVFQKTEKLVKAIYLLTSLMSDKEPMKERSRTIANDMLGSVLKMSERIWGEEDCYKKLLSAISEVSILFDIAEATRMMSKMNKQIINSELQKLSNFLITSSENYSSAKIAFEPNIFDNNYNYIPNSNFQTPVSTKDLNTEIISARETGIYMSKGQNEMSDTSFKNKTSFTKTISSQKKIKDKNNRQDVIVGMLKGGAKLMIKDFAKNIKGCSEKTIQRELIALLSKGVLKKEGERRWSKYFLS